MDILLLSGDALLSKIFVSRAKMMSMKVEISEEITSGLENIRKGLYKAVVATISMHSEFCPQKMIKKVQEMNPYLPVFFLLDQQDFSQVIKLTKLGAEYCFSKPFVIENVLENIERTLNNLPAPPLVKKDVVLENSSGYLNTNSIAAHVLSHQIDLVADTNFKVIIYGETGTGKESVARRLSSGIYKDKPFIAVDCGCLSKELAASELFGHKKGSFSGAYEDKTGAFEAANNGTIFLDEIGNLDYSVQILLLRAIQEMKIKKIGCNKEIDINVRIIVASNERLTDAIQAGKFREDLFYRLNEFEISIPSLRERVDDLESFIDFFIEGANHDLNKRITGVEPALLAKMQHYDWPGNIRELKNVIRRGCLIADTIITEDCMSSEFIAKLSDYKFKAEYAKELAPELLLKDDLKYKSIQAEYEEIVKILKEENYNKSRTAQRLNINRKTLYNKIKIFRDIAINNNLKN